MIRDMQPNMTLRVASSGPESDIGVCSELGIEKEGMTFVTQTFGDTPSQPTYPLQLDSRRFFLESKENTDASAW